MFTERLATVASVLLQAALQWCNIARLRYSSGTDTGIARQLPRRLRGRYPFPWRRITLTMNRFAGHANPSTSPRIRKRKYTLCPECTILDIQVLRKCLAGSAYRNAPVPIDLNMPQGWWR